MSYTVSNIADIIHANILQQGDDMIIDYLLTDSRKLLFPQGSLFFALPGTGRSGASFIANLYENGLGNFVVGPDFEKNKLDTFPGAFFLQVPDTLAALQQLSSFHRHRFHFPVIGITGSNGKTIVKEWLNQLLGEDYSIIRSPNSYNSQVGVPLSVWRINESHELGIFESGVSRSGEMEKLQRIIDPEIGIITFIGSAHAEGFQNKEEKIREKLRLFENSRLLIFNADDEKLLAGVAELIASQNSRLTVFTRSKNKPADLFVREIQKKTGGSVIKGVYRKNKFSFKVPFTDDASIDNALTCCCTLLAFNISTDTISERMPHLRPLEMRLELKQGSNNCSVINDSYSADLSSLSISLDFLEQQKQHAHRTVILSDVLQTGRDADALYRKIAGALGSKKIYRFIGIGPEISSHADAFSALKNTRFYPSTDAFLQDLPALDLHNETILLKGARVFRFEKISHALEQKLHETFMEINLNALRHNVKAYRGLMQPGVKMMAMVKAFSYGSGTFEIANLLQHSGVEYLGVAYADEGVELRKAGISLPIMVMNTEASGFDHIVKYNLQPEIYSFNILHAFRQFLQHKKIHHYPVHIKADTGMHRLGFEHDETEALCHALEGLDSFKVISVFSHLAGSDAAEHDDFSMQQSAMFIKMADRIEAALGYSFMRHIANSSAVFRHPQLQMDMVRLGIGLYGVDASPEMQQQLQHVATLKTTISQIRTIQKGESVGYSRKGMATRDSVIATVRIGYADGYPRSLSNGRGKMLVNGNPAPVIGNVCMDMTMLDITGIDAAEGDEVIVFGESPSVTDTADWAGTISYEILTNISQRVKRVYFEE